MIAAAGVINLENGQKKTAIWYIEDFCLVCRTSDDEEIIRIPEKEFRNLLSAYCNSNPANDKGKGSKGV